MRTILLTIAYDGTDYYGWQIQPDLPTVQGEIEKALHRVTGKEIHINGTGRTDRGVHAYGQCATFRIGDGIPTERIAYALNNSLPGGIRIVRAEEKPEGFHARFDAKGKTYRYRLLLTDRERKDAAALTAGGVQQSGRQVLFLRNYVYQVKQPLDLAAMRKAAAAMEGTHDFACFQAAGGEERETTVRTVYRVELTERFLEEGFFPEEEGAHVLDIDVTGDGFLYNMVRIMAGTLVDVGSGRIGAADVPAIIESADREKAGHTAPPQGLYLMRVYFEEDFGHGEE